MGAIWSIFSTFFVKLFLGWRRDKQQRADIIDADRAKGHAAEAKLERENAQVLAQGMSNEQLDHKLDDQSF